MASAALVRQQVEHSVSARIPSALSPRHRAEPEQTACGVAAIDMLLHGGLPEGCVTELVGSQSSGRTTMALAYLAAMTQAGGVCAWIDTGDTLHPESATASGVDLERLLWVRCGGGGEVAEASEMRPAGSQRGQEQATAPVRQAGCGSPHPRSEGKDMPQAVEALMRKPHESLDEVAARRAKKSVGTPGAPNRPLTAAYKPQQREEQVNSDRMPPRRGENLALVPRTAEPLPRPVASVPATDRPWSTHRGMPVLDQALRAADLLLQGGGFGCIVLDLGSISPEVAWRIPLATWFRFRAACDRTRTSLMVLSQHPCARSSAELVVRLQSGAMESENRVMTGIRYQAAVERSRSHERKAQVVAFRKPPQSERPGQWTSRSAWAR